MDRRLFRALGLVIATLLFVVSQSPAADDPIREKALKLNQVTGNSAMETRLQEMLKDEAGTKKLIETGLKMVKEKPKTLNYNACFLLAKAAQFQKNMDASLAFYRICTEDAAKIGAASKVADVLESMIDLYTSNKKFDEAIRTCQEFLEMQADDPESSINQMKPFILEKLIIATAKKGKIEDALKMADELVDKDTGGWYFVRLKGDLYREAEKYGDAADTYLESLERLKKNTRLSDEQRERFVKLLRYTLSNVYVEMKQIDKSAEQLEELLKADPDNATFLNDLGYIWADHDMKLEESEKLIRKAIDKDRASRKKIENLSKEDDVDNAAYLDSLGWVLYKKKDYKEAKKQLQEAIKQKEGKHIEIYDHLAEVHMKLGEKAEAIKIWKEALGFEDLTRREKERRKVIEAKLAELEKK
jgi:tetratricopeptide (TPR) repeat protein